MPTSQRSIYLTGLKSQYQRRGKGKRSQARSNYNPYRRNPYYEFTSRFNANDTLDPFFTYVRPTYPPLRETQSNGRPLPVLHSTLDAYAASEDPSYIPMSQELLRADMFAMGANEDTLEKYMADHNKVVQDLLDRCGGHLPSRGVRSVIHVIICATADWSIRQRKPRPGVDEVMVYNIPNSDLAIRIWEGGMRDLGQYCLDLVSRARRGEVVNTPKAWKFTFVPLPGTFMPGGQLLPWETNFGIREVLPGQERYSAPEGSRLALIRDGCPPFLFQIPTRPYCDMTFHLPQPVPPYF